MFSLCKTWAQRCGEVLYNLASLSTKSTNYSPFLSLAGYLYKQCTQNLHQLVHSFYSVLTGVMAGFYPQSTEPITTTTLNKGGQK